MKLKILEPLKGVINRWLSTETKLMALGKLLVNQQLTLNFNQIQDYEFKIYSQWGDDGIIQYLIKSISIENKVFIEFGVEDYQEANTRFLMMNNNWEGLVIDGSADNIKRLKGQKWYWQYGLEAVHAFITKENINSIVSEYNRRNIGLLHIDIDGNDYHILETIDLAFLNPSILILEYNSNFGAERMITIPYNASFYRQHAHYSNIYYGASLAALNYLAEKKGYSFIGCNSNGMNSYFVRNDLLNDKVKKIDCVKNFTPMKIKEARDEKGNLSFKSYQDRVNLIKGLPVLNVVTNEVEPF